jgi:ABC-type branched-subunit amino acid transport system permease subunit
LNENALPLTTVDSEEPNTQATLEEILPILVILLTGLLASIFCLLAEIFVFRLRNRFIQQHINCNAKLIK